MSTVRFRRSLGIGASLLLWALSLSLLLTFSSVQLQDPLQQVRRFTRGAEFDFLTWTLDAAAVKVRQASLGTSGYLDRVHGREVVLEYLQLVRVSEEQQAGLAQVYADASLDDRQAAAAPLAARLARTRAVLQHLQPAAEAVLQEQVAVVLADLGLGVGGAGFPPVSFQVSLL